MEPLEGKTVTGRNFYHPVLECDTNEKNIFISCYCVQPLRFGVFWVQQLAYPDGYTCEALKSET